MHERAFAKQHWIVNHKSIERHNLGWAVVTMLYKNCLLCHDQFVNMIMQTKKQYVCMMTEDWSHQTRNGLRFTQLLRLLQSHAPQVQSSYLRDVLIDSNNFHHIMQSQFNVVSIQLQDMKCHWHCVTR